MSSCNFDLQFRFKIQLLDIVFQYVFLICRVSLETKIHIGKCRKGYSTHFHTLKIRIYRKGCCVSANQLKIEI